MAAPKRSELEIERDRVRIADLYLKGWSQAKIAVDLGVSRQQIGYDLKAIRKQWLESSLLDFNARKAQELAKLDRLEEYAWDMLAKSDGDQKEVIEEESDREGVESSKKVTKRWRTISDSKWGRIVIDCISKRCDILAVNAPTKVALTDPDGNAVKQMSDEERAVEAARLLAKAAERKAADAEKAALSPTVADEPEGVAE
jgi:hypothetical protein